MKRKRNLADVRNKAAGDPKVFAAFKEVSRIVGLPKDMVAGRFKEFFFEAADERIPHEVFTALRGMLSMKHILTAYGIRAIVGHNNKVSAYLPVVLTDESVSKQIVLVHKKDVAVAPKKRRGQGAVRARHNAYAGPGAFSAVLNTTYAPGGFGRGTIYSSK